MGSTSSKTSEMEVKLQNGDGAPTEDHTLPPFTPENKSSNDLVASHRPKDDSNDENLAPIIENSSKAGEAEITTQNDEGALTKDHASCPTTMENETSNDLEAFYSPKDDSNDDNLAPFIETSKASGVEITTQSDEGELTEHQASRPPTAEPEISDHAEASLSTNGDCAEIPSKDTEMEIKTLNSEVTPSEVTLAENLTSLPQILVIDSLDNAEKTRSTISDSSKAATSENKSLDIAEESHGTNDDFSKVATSENKNVDDNAEESHITNDDSRKVATSENKSLNSEEESHRTNGDFKKAETAEDKTQNNVGAPHSTNGDSNKVETSGKSQAAAIRRQVEYYLSDKNLSHDTFLVSKIHGYRNFPLSIEYICTFKRMRQYQPLSAVVEALRESKILDVVNVDGKDCVVRKTPFQQGKKAQPTGFEEYWAEPTLSPAQYAEEENLYDPDRSFAERIETALQRYRAKRRFTAKGGSIYTKFLKYGGIITGPKPFAGGLDRETREENNAAEIATITATEFVGEDKYETGPDATWTVDFEAVAKGFLSSVIPLYFEIRTDAEARECTNILLNFYNYLLFHNVCPEYAASVLAAREICNVANRELLPSLRALELLPGAFNMACSTLFGGRYKGLYAGDKDWNTDFAATDHKVGMSDLEARQVYALAVAAYGADEIFDNVDTLRKMQFEQVIVSSENNVGLEVTGIEDADDDVRAMYEKDMGGRFGTLGRLRCKPWEAPSFATYDLPLDYVPPERPAEYVFLMEKAVLDWCFVGMKIETSIHTLSGGWKFFDAVLGVHCSFFTYLENELLRGWKELKMYTREEQLEKDKGDLEEELGSAAMDI